jgi:hypothetical protein
MRGEHAADVASAAEPSLAPPSLERRHQASFMMATNS